MMPMGKPTRLPAFNKPAGPDPMMDQRLDMLRMLMQRKRDEQRARSGRPTADGIRTVGGTRPRGVPRLPVDQVMKVMR